MSVAATRRAGKRILLRYGHPRMSKAQVLALAGTAGLKKGAKVAKVRSAVRAKTGQKK